MRSHHLSDVTHRALDSGRTSVLEISAEINGDLNFKIEKI